MNLFRNSAFKKVCSEKTIRVAALFLVVCTASAARAQNSAPPSNQAAANANAAPQTSASPLQSPTPIPFSEIITQAENAAATLKEIQASASSDAATDQIERELPVLTDEINARLEETAQVVEGSTSLDRLRTFETDWRTLTNNLPGWRTDLTQRARKLESDLKRLDDLIERWQQTATELRGAAETPPEVLARVEDILRTAADARREIVAQQARVVALQTRVAEQQTRVAGALQTIAARREALVGQLLVQDSPPVWSADLWTRGDVRQNVSDSLATQFTGLTAFAIRNKDKLAIHFLIFALLAGALLYLRKWARPLIEANPDLKQAAIIFRLPVSTALVLAIIFGARIYPQTPQILRAILGAAALVPTVVILRKLLEETFRPLLYSLVAFYFVDQLRLIFDDVPALARPLFLAEMLAGFLFFLWFYRARLRREPPADLLGKTAFKVVRIAALAVLPFFAIAFLANVFGYVNLARLVGNGVLRSAYAALVLYAIVRIIDGLIAFALRFRPLNLLKMARDYAPEIQEKAQKIVRFVALVLWLVITLEFFTLRRTVFDWVTSVLTAELTLGSLSISALDVLLFFFVVWAAFQLSRFVRFALEEDVYPRFSLEQGIPYAVSTIVNYVILLVGLFFAVSAAGFDLTRVTVLVGAFGVGIGFGLQNIFNNFVSGLILLFERPVKIGDEIKIGDANGTVRRIGIRASHIKQWDNSVIIVPNSKLISENVKNSSFTTRKRGVEVPISVAYGSDTNKVVELLEKVAKAHPLVAEKPAPQVILGEIVSNALNFKLRAWTAQADKTTQLATELAIAASRTLAENNVEVPPVPVANPVS